MGHLMLSICAAPNLNHQHPKPQAFWAQWGRGMDSVENQWGMRYIRIVSRIISGEERRIVEPRILEARRASTCVRIMRVTLSSVVNIVFMARTVIIPTTHTLWISVSLLGGSSFVGQRSQIFGLHCNSCVLANQVYQSHWETKTWWSWKMHNSVFQYVTFIILLSCSPLITSYITLC